MSDALNYMEFVVQTIRDKELFHSIEITFEQCWEYLTWLDVHNYGGIKGKLPKDIENTTDTNNENAEDENDDEPEIVMNWNLMECLPKEAACRSSFTAIIAGYFHAIYQFILEHELNTTVRPRNLNNLSQLSHNCTTAQLGLGSLENTAEFAKKLIKGDMSQKLFQIVQKIHKNLPEKTLTIEEYPNLDLDGKNSKKINPALELIKSVCKVLSLDAEVENEVYYLRTNMLKLIRVGSFSDLVDWKDPCISLIVPEIICKVCNHTRDIDLCKDNFCTMDRDRYIWKCPLCKMDYDNDEIEFLLMDMLDHKSMAYMLQDLQCCKCNEIKRENMNELCSCSGNFKTLIPKSEIEKFMKICKSVAIKSNMKTLLEIIQNTKVLVDSK